MISDSALRLWAKPPSDGSPRPHPLMCHMLDVAFVARALWTEGCTAAFRTDISWRISRDDGEAGRMLAFLAGLHDLGKASPPFQGRWPACKGALEPMGLAFPRLSDPRPHVLIAAGVVAGAQRLHGRALDGRWGEALGQPIAAQQEHPGQMA